VAAGEMAEHHGQVGGDAAGVVEGAGVVVGAFDAASEGAHGGVVALDEDRRLRHRR
jgi:hypothetical protein